MSQQINLLVRQKTTPTSAIMAAATLGLVLLAIASIWGIRQSEVNAAARAEAASAQMLQEAKARLEARTNAANGDIAGQIAALQSRADAAQRLLAQVSGMGSPQGYSRYLALLATLGQDGLWLTNVDIGSGGNSVAISGRALREDAVIRYAQRLNTLFATFNIQFTSLEMAPVSVGSASGSKAPPLSAVTFKLSA